ALVAVCGNEHPCYPTRVYDLVTAVVAVLYQQLGETDPVTLPRQHAAVRMRSAPLTVEPYPRIARSQTPPQRLRNELRVTHAGGALENQRGQLRIGTLLRPGRARLA